MARIRTIKPEFWTDEKILECSPTARLLFIGLWNFADDQGNIEGGHRSIKSKIFPSDDMNVIGELCELEEVGLLIPYKVNGESYYNIKSFDKHQNIDKKSKPRCPLYPDSTNTLGMIEDPSITEVVSSKGREVGSVKPIVGPTNKKLSKKQKEQEFITRYERYRGEKDSRKLALGHWNTSINTQMDLQAYDQAEQNYYAIVDLDHRNGFKDRRYKGAKTWFNNWLEYVDQQPPPETPKIVGGLPLPDQEPSGHNELAAKIVEKMAFCEEHLADTEWEGAPPNLKWLNLAVGHLILEYSERFPKGPHIAKYTAWLDIWTKEVLAVGDST